MEKLDRAAVENLDPTQRAELLLHLERPDVSDERRQQILDALARATAPRPGEGQARKMQDWLLFPLFLQQRHWQLLQASEGGELPKIRGISRHLAELGLRAPSEHTMAMIVSVLHGGKLDHWDPQKLHNYFLTVKGLVRPELQRWKSAAQSVPQELVPRMPENFLHAFKEDPAVPPQTPGGMMELLSGAKIVPCRTTHRSLSHSSLAPAAGPAATAAQGLNVLGALLQQLLGGQPLQQQPRIQIMEPQAKRLQSMLQAMPAEHCPEPPFRHGASDQPAAPSDSAGTAEAARSMPLALTEGPTDSGATGSADSAAQMSGAARADAKADDPAMALQQEASWKPEPVPLEESLARLTAAAETARGDKPMHMKRPASAEGGGRQPRVLKKPAAADRQLEPMKKPSAKAATVMRRPAAAAGEGAGKPMPPRSTQLRFRPRGCSRCRGRGGCTPSCWKRRGYGD